MDDYGRFWAISNSNHFKAFKTKLICSTNGRKKGRKSLSVEPKNARKRVVFRVELWGSLVPEK